MSKIRRKRAVVLALIAFFCTAASVSVDWRRFGGGFLAFFKSRSGPIVVSTGGPSAGSNGAHIADAQNVHHDGSSLPVLALASSHRHAASSATGTGDDGDLFKYGNPAAGGIPPGSFIVARNDAPPTVDRGTVPPVDVPVAPEITGGPAPGGVTTPAPAPTIGGAVLPATDAGTPPAPAPSSTPPAPAPTPTQSGTTDPNGGDGGTPAPAPLPPVSVIPEASSLQMMSLGLLFLAVAAARRRKTR